MHAFTASGNPSVPGATLQPHSARVSDFSLEPKWHTPRSGPALCLYLHLKENISAKWHKNSYVYSGICTAVEIMPLTPQTLKEQTVSSDHECKMVGIFVSAEGSW